MAKHVDKLTGKQKAVSLTILAVSFLLACAATAVYAVAMGTVLTAGSLLFTYAAIFMLFSGLYLYTFFLDRKLLTSYKQMILVNAALILGTVLNLVIGAGLNQYIRPLALAGLLAAVLISRSLGIYVNLVQCILILIIDCLTTGPGITSVLVPTVLSAAILGMVCGIVFLFLTARTRRRIGMVAVGLELAAVTAAAAVVIEALGGTLGMNLLYSALWGAGCSLVTIMLFMALLPVFEFLFNCITDYRLMELSDHSSKLLVELAEKAPGTFNHSIIVGNLAEKCAAAIGENTNLARAAAYYHDIGKILNPEYFTENQAGGENPHDDITPEVSVSIIKNHTVNGAELGRKYRLPKAIIDVILEHHGTLPIKVFYYKALKYTDGNLGLDNYSYEGPKPHSKIAAIMMIADACEAAVRTTQDRSRENVDKLVNGIIDERMRLNQFTNCEITMRDLHTVKDTIVDTVSGVYHERIKYPDIALGKEGALPEREKKSE